MGQMTQPTVCADLHTTCTVCTTCTHLLRAL